MSKEGEQTRSERWKNMERARKEQVKTLGGVGAYVRFKKKPEHHYRIRTLLGDGRVQVERFVFDKEFTRLVSIVPSNVATSPHELEIDPRPSIEAFLPRQEGPE